MAQEPLEIQNLPRSCNELLILSVLREGELHGYEIALAIEERSDGAFVFNHGTLYPILHKMEKEGILKGRWEREEGQRRRKCYALTSKGRDYLSSRMGAWKSFLGSFHRVTGAGTP